MTKIEQCPTCKFGGCDCFSNCDNCAMHSVNPLIAAKHAGGYVTHCKCLSIEFDRFCPYYRRKEVPTDDKA